MESLEGECRELRARLQVGASLTTIMSSLSRCEKGQAGVWVMFKRRRLMMSSKRSDLP